MSYPLGVSIKGIGWAFNWLKWLCGFLHLEQTPPTILFLNSKVDIWHPTVGLRCRNPPRHFSQLKARPILLIETFEFSFVEGSLYKYHMKNILRTQSSYPLGVSIKGIDRAFNWLMCLCGFLHLKPIVGINPLRHFSQLKARPIPLIEAPNGQELCRP
jgi:hypothetical protein